MSRFLSTGASIGYVPRTLSSSERMPAHPEIPPTTRVLNLRTVDEEMRASALTSDAMN